MAAAAAVLRQDDGEAPRSPGTAADFLSFFRARPTAAARLFLEILANFFFVVDDGGAASLFFFCAMVLSGQDSSSLLLDKKRTTARQDRQIQAVQLHIVGHRISWHQARGYL